jgi:hypothetical protein
MSQLKIKANETFSIDVTVRESDKYTSSVFVKFERQFSPESIHGCDEFFLTPTQLHQLGQFFIKQADEIRTEQSFREVV